MKRITYTITPYTTVIRPFGVVQNPANGFSARPLGRNGDQFLQISDDPTTDQDEKRWYKGRYDRWVGLLGAVLMVIGFALQIVPYVAKLLY